MQTAFKCLFISVVFLVAAGGSAVAATAVEGRLSNGRGDDSVVVTLTNNSREDIYFLRWSVPEEGGLTTDYFMVLDHDGVQQRYLGRYVERPLPSRADYALLRAGASATFTVNIAAYYELSGRPPYRVSAPGNFVPYFSRSAFDPNAAGKWAMFSGIVTLMAR